MKTLKNLIYLLIVFILISSCSSDDESLPNFDCPEIEANIGDPCVNPNGVEGTISEDCVCLT